MNETGIYVERSATLRRDGGPPESKNLADWRQLPAYVLLGEPGSGKTTAFREEAAAMGNAASFTSARDLLLFGPPTDWDSSKVLFIDALDEHRGSSNGAETALDAVRKKLFELDRPKFRLSCREADWAASGVHDLVRVSPTGEVDALWLDPLAAAGVRQMLEHWTPTLVRNADDFLEQVDKKGLQQLLGNPLLLWLLVKAVHNNKWPAGRGATYELACQYMAQEHNHAHRTPGKLPPSVADVLHAAGLASALLLLSDKRTFTVNPTTEDANLMQWHDGEAVLSQLNSQVHEVAQNALFAVEGDLHSYRHRTIAEFLAAKSVARLIERDGLPLNRVLSLMTGYDGRVLDSLRGFYAWLAIHCRTYRTILLELDPVALVLYGDVQDFTSDDKAKLLDRLREEGEHVRWTKNISWKSHPFGALGTRNMLGKLSAELENPSREPSHQFLISCVLDAVRYGEPLPELAPKIEAVVRDGTYMRGVRHSALSVLLDLGLLQMADAKKLLGEIRNETVSDDDEELGGLLLSHLYPDGLTVEEAMVDLRTRKRKSFIGEMHMFWAIDFLKKTKPENMSRVADVLVERNFMRSRVKDDAPPDEEAYEVRGFVTDVLARTLFQVGDSSSTEQLHKWLGIAVDQYGFQRLETGKVDTIHSWLSDRPERLKELYAHGLKLVEEDPRFGHRSFWTVAERLLRAKLPRDWFTWLLRVGADTGDQDIARFCLEQAAHAALNPSADFDITLENVEHWVEEQDEKWPAAEEWRSNATSWKLDAMQAREYERIKKSDARYAAQRAERQRKIAPHLPQVYEGTAWPSIYNNIYGAYRKWFYDVHGDTPLERVQDLLAVDEAAALKAIGGLKKILLRDDLPSPEDVLKSYLDGRKTYFLTGPSLLAAQLAMEADPQAWRLWGAALKKSLVAFLYTAGGIDTAVWYRPLMTAEPALVAGVLLPFGVAELSKQTEPQLYRLLGSSSERISSALALEVLPSVFRALPDSPSEGQLRATVHDVIPCMAELLEPPLFYQLVTERLARPTVEPKLALALHLAACRTNPDLHTQQLVALIDSDATLAMHLDRGLEVQGEKTLKAIVSVPKSAGRLIEALVATAPSVEEAEPGASINWYRDSSYRLTRALAENPEREAGEELTRLSQTLAGTHIEPSLGILRFEQAELARRAHFEAASPPAVAKLLANKEPASAKDMGELIRDHLSTLAKKIHLEETNALDLFYEPGQDGAPKPKGENACRDVLLVLIKEKVQAQGVLVDKEVQHAAERRADLQGGKLVSSGRIIVPVEIKKDNHPQVWTAWKDQLEKQYVAHPESEGIGIYIVLWFGHKTKPAPNKVKPKSAQEMAEMFSALIPADRRGHILGLVIDLSAVGRKVGARPRKSAP